MKNVKIIWILSFLILMIFQQCSFDYKKGNGKIVVEEKSLHEFRKISVGGNYKVKLHKAENSYVRIETDENLIPFINIEEFDSVLNINNVHNLNSTNGISIEIYYVRLEKIYSTGFSYIETTEPIETEKLEIDLSGAGALTLELETDEVELNLTGTGVVTLTGRTDEQDIHISGAGGLKALDLISNECNIGLSGVGGAEVFVNEKLEATITGLGGIKYDGNPKIIERQVTGLGSITRIE